MNKRILLALGGAVVLVGGWVGASSYAGARIEADLQAFMAKPVSETGLHLQNLQHQKGTFASSGSFEAQPILKGIPDAPTVLISYHVSHLALPGSMARVNWSIKPTGDIAQGMTAAFGTLPQLEGKGSVAYNGGIDTSLALNALSMNKDGEKFSLSPSTGHFSLDGVKVGLAWNTDKLTARGSGSALEVDKVALDINTSDRTLGIGTTLLTVDKISTSDGSAEGFRHTSDVTRDGERLNVHTSDTLKAGTFSGQAASDLALEIAVTGLDITSLKSIADIINKSDGLTNLTSEEDQTFRKNLQTVLNRGLSVAITKLSGTVAQDSINGHISVDLKKAATDSDPIDLVKQLKSAGELSVKGPNLAPSMTQMAVAMGAAQATADGLKATLEYADGTLRANGRTLDAAMVVPPLEQASQAINQALTNPLKETLANGLSDPSAEAEAAAPAEGEENPDAQPEDNQEQQQ